MAGEWRAEADSCFIRDTIATQLSYEIQQQKERTPDDGVMKRKTNGTETPLCLWPPLTGHDRRKARAGPYR